jgi:hypothetical protein
MANGLVSELLKRVPGWGASARMGPEVTAQVQRTPVTLGAMPLAPGAGLLGATKAAPAAKALLRDLQRRGLPVDTEGFARMLAQLQGQETKLGGAWDALHGLSRTLGR